MVKTRRQEQQEQQEQQQQQQQQLRKRQKTATKDDDADEEPQLLDDAKPAAASSSPTTSIHEKTTRVEDTARRKANQPLVDELHRLSAAMFRAQKADTKNRYKGMAISRAAHAVAQLDFDVKSGRELSQGAGKVTGIGKGTANYIDEFLEAGELYEIEEYDRMAQEAEDMMEEEGGVAEKENKGMEPPTTTKAAHTKEESDNTAEDQQVYINRAPVLVLWVTVVAQRQGFNRSEALTYGKFVSAMFAQSKGKALGLFKAKHGTKEERDERKQMDKDLGVRHVQGFGRMEIPTLVKDGNRLAVIQGETQDPASVEDYLERRFGDKLEAVQNAMKELAETLPREQLKEKAYKLYEAIRPEWKGWGKKSLLDLTLVCNLANQFV